MTKTLETLETHEMPVNVTEPSTWKALKTHLSRWFYKPDFEALEVVISAVGAHYAVQGDPCWLFVQGPSSSGKTAIIITALEKAPHAAVASELNKHAFLSFYRGEKSGLLLEIGQSGILLFKDLTTLLSKREDERSEIISQLREIYDGRFVRNTGTGKSDWKGKVTVIAACTPALERAWAFKRDLGERFLTVRWTRDGSVEFAEKGAEQRGHEAAITVTTQELGAKLFANPPRSLTPLKQPFKRRIAGLARIVAELRPHVEHLRGKVEVSDVTEPEEPGRVMKSLGLLASAHAALWGREMCEDDFRIAKRVAFDSIPARRYQILRCFTDPEMTKLTRTELCQRMKATRSIVDYYVEELKALGALTEINSGIDDVLLVTPKAIELLSVAGLSVF